MSVDLTLERRVRQELGRQHSLTRRADVGYEVEHCSIQGILPDRKELHGHLLRVAHSVPAAFRPVAWLHHAADGNDAPSGAYAANLSSEELTAIELLGDADPLGTGGGELERLHEIAAAPGPAGRIARVVAGAALSDVMRSGHAVADHFDALKCFASEHALLNLAVPAGIGVVRV